MLWIVFQLLNNSVLVFEHNHETQWRQWTPTQGMKTSELCNTSPVDHIIGLDSRLTMEAVQAAVEEAEAHPLKGQHRVL